MTRLNNNFFLFFRN